MKILSSKPFDSARASFQTHLNYIKCLEHLLQGSSLVITKTSSITRRDRDIERFRKLYKVTKESIIMDIELARTDNAFAVIAAPWFPVKCYYALYYLESILVHLIDGATHGFQKGGHGGVRNKLCTNINTGVMVFSSPELNRTLTLKEVEQLPPIESGKNTRSRYWQDSECNNSLLKKLAEYKLHDAKLGRKWNLLTKKDRSQKSDFIEREHIALIDFFYWYRIKANYRDLDYIDFENGITESEVLDYMESYFRAYTSYKDLIREHINHFLAV